MPRICYYFQLHQPYRLGSFDVFDLGNGHDYFLNQEAHNRKIFLKVAKKSYWPMLTLLRDLVQEQEDFRFALSLSGVFVEQAREWQPALIGSLRELVASKQVELLGETYYHSLASLYAPDEFAAQVEQHHDLMQELFNTTPTTFRNTELVYADSIAPQVSELGFEGMLTEAVPRYLGDRPKTQLYRSAGEEVLPLLLKHAEFSDDIAFRFSNQSWEQYPLHAETYVHWLEQYHHDDIINLFMDFETFGEHQWEDTGIFEFFRSSVEQLLERQAQFVLPRQMFDPECLSAAARRELPRYHVPEPISWADVDRDLTAWIENAMQRDSLGKIYELGARVRARKDQRLLDTWRKLQTSDHFYYMCTKWAADGDVHAYFSPYDSPYEAYRKYSIVLSDLYHELLE